MYKEKERERDKKREREREGERNTIFLQRHIDRYVYTFMEGG